MLTEQQPESEKVMPREDPCPECNATGKIVVTSDVRGEDVIITCPVCDGGGYVPSPKQR